jgi:hypothetical protein
VMRTRNTSGKKPLSGADTNQRRGGAQEKVGPTLWPRPGRRENNGRSGRSGSSGAEGKAKRRFTKCMAPRLVGECWDLCDPFDLYDSFIQLHTYQALPMQEKSASGIRPNGAPCASGVAAPKIITFRIIYPLISTLYITRHTYSLQIFSIPSFIRLHINNRYLY